MGIIRQGLPPFVIRARAALRRAALVAAAATLLVPLGIAASGSPSGVVAVTSAVPLPWCLGSQLSARITSWQGAAGSRVADVVLVNTSFQGCRIRDLPRVRLVGPYGGILINGHAASTTAAVHVIAPLRTLRTEVSDSNYCGSSTYYKPVTLAFILPGLLGRVIAMPLTPTDTSGVPPCLGAPGSAGHISMHAWH